MIIARTARWAVINSTLSVPRNSLIWLNLRLRHSGIRLNGQRPAYNGHIPLNWFENAFLAVESAVMSLVDSRRGGELSVHPYFSKT
jgi:hypothetical protein